MTTFKRILKWAGIAVGSLIGLLILIAVLVGIFGGDDNGDQANNATAPAAGTPGPTATDAPTPTPIAVTASVLQMEHEANKVAWTNKYENKFVLITGIISSITEAGDQYDVKLSTDDAWVEIVCKMSRSETETVLELQAGETATVYGRVTDDGFVDIVVRDCVVRQLESAQQGQTPAATAVPTPTLTFEPTPAATLAGLPTSTVPAPTPIAVTASVLQMEHEANKVSWTHKYEDKFVLITGIISSITEAGDQYDVKLDTDDAWVEIVCKVSRSETETVLELRAEETVTVYGRVTDDGIVDIVVRDCVIQQLESAEQATIETSVPIPTPTTTIP